MGTRSLNHVGDPFSILTMRHVATLDNGSEDTETQYITNIIETGHSDSNADLLERALSGSGRRNAVRADYSPAFKERRRPKN